MTAALVVADGLGNIFECLPVITTLEREKGWRVSIAVIGANYAIDERVLGDRYVSIDDAMKSDPLLATGKAWRLMRERGMGERPGAIVGAAANEVGEWTRSEVDMRLDMCRGLGCTRMHYDYALRTLPVDRPYDIVIANGYNIGGNPKDCWDAKQYGGWAEVVEAIRRHKPEVRIASLGTDEAREHVPGTDSLIGLPLDATLGHVKAAGLLLSNDTGLYHAAALLGTPTLVYFTFTDEVKNYEPQFHRRARVLGRVDLECRAGCWKGGRVRRCTDRRCREFPAEAIAGVAMDMLDEGRGEELKP